MKVAATATQIGSRGGFLMIAAESLCLGSAISLACLVDVQLIHFNMAAHETLVLWTDGDWRCDYHPVNGDAGRLEIYHGDRLVTAEGTLSLSLAKCRAEILHHRVIRGDLCWRVNLGASHDAHSLPVIRCSSKVDFGTARTADMARGRCGASARNDLTLRPLHRLC